MPVRPVLHGDNGSATHKGNHRAGHAALARHQAILLAATGKAMTTPSPRRCSALPSIGRSFRSRGLPPICTPPGNGRCGLRPGSGTTTNIAIVASATSPRRSVMPDRMVPCSPLATWSTKTRAHATRNVGAGKPVTGNQSAPSPSIRSATSSSGRQPHQSCFPVRSASLLSRPDLAASKPRSATQEMGGAEPPAATRSAPRRARAW